MKIIDERKGIFKMFEELDFGDCFTSPKFACPLIKIKGLDEGKYAVCLDDGFIFEFSNDEIVQKINAEVVIHDE